MLKSIRIQNFKSYKDTTLELAPLTLMIGANASGKTNAIEALKLINYIIDNVKTDDIKRFFDAGTMRGTLSSLYGEIKKEIEFNFRFYDTKESMSKFDFKLKNINNSCQIISENLYLNSKPIYTAKVGSGKNKDSKDYSLYNSEGVSSWKAVDFPLDSLSLHFYPYYYEIINDMGKDSNSNPLPQNHLTTSKKVEDGLKNMIFLDALPCKMRDYEEKINNKNDNNLTTDGSNLSAVIFKLCNEKKNKAKNKKALLDFIKSLPEQNISDITFIETNPGGKNKEIANDDVMVQLVETFGENEKVMSASLLSDGTLRVLAIGSLLLSAPKGTLLVIEEIDNGVHPSRINELMQQIKDIATSRKLQVLITSHNPALLDAIPDSSLEDVICCYRDKDKGDSRLIRLGDIHKYPELIAQGTLGELVTDSIIDRYIHDKTTPEEDKAKSLAWIEDRKKRVESRQ